MKRNSIQKSLLLLLSSSILLASCPTVADDSEKKNYKRLFKWTVEANTSKTGKIKLGSEFKIVDSAWFYFDLQMDTFSFLKAPGDSNDDESGLIGTLNQAIPNCHVEMKNSSGEYAVKIGKMHNECSDKKLIGLGFEAPRVGFWFDIGSIIDLRIKRDEKSIASLLLTFKPKDMTLETGFNLDEIGYSDEFKKIAISGHISMDYGKEKGLLDQINKIKLEWGLAELFKKSFPASPSLSLDITSLPKKLFGKYEFDVTAGIKYTQEKVTKLSCKLKFTLEKDITLTLKAEMPVKFDEPEWPTLSLSAKSVTKWTKY